MLQKSLKADKGLSLIEVCVGMMLMSVIGIAVSSLLISAVNSQMDQRTQSNMQLVASNIVDDIRYDLMRCMDSGPMDATYDCFNSITANEIRFRRLSDEDPSTPGYVPFYLVTYTRTAAGNFERTSANPLEPTPFKRYNENFRPALQVDCAGNNPGACFSRPALQQLLIRGLIVRPVPTGGQNVYDVHFGTQQYRVNNVSFNIMASTNFQ